MKLLGLDTATPATTVALLDSDTGAAIERRDDPPRGARPRHTSQLMGLIVEALKAGGAGWGDVGLIAVGIGPGTFTGLRIGVATARALAQARDIGLVGISTLRSLAGAAADQGDGAGEPVLAVLDARRGEVFAAGWSAPPIARAAPAPLLAPAAMSPEALAEIGAGLDQPWLAVGDGAVEFRVVLERSGALIPEDDSALHRVTAIEHCRLAEGRRPEPPESVAPEYLRVPDAELSRRRSRKP